MYFRLKTRYTPCEHVVLITKCLIKYTTCPVGRRQSVPLQRSIWKRFVESMPLHPFCWYFYTIEEEWSSGRKCTQQWGKQTCLRRNQRGDLCSSLLYMSISFNVQLPCSACPGITFIVPIVKARVQLQTASDRFSPNVGRVAVTSSTSTFNYICDIGMCHSVKIVYIP